MIPRGSTAPLLHYSLIQIDMQKLHYKNKLCTYIFVISCATFRSLYTVKYRAGYI